MANVATLSTSADLSASQTAGAAALLMPTGVVLPYAGTAAPSGWLACNGSAISRTLYATLFSAIGTSFGVGDGSTTFNLPDLRGRFPRFNDAMFGGSAAGRDSGRVHGSAQTQATARNGLTATAAASSISGSSGTGSSVGGVTVDASGGGGPWSGHQLSRGGTVSYGGDGSYPGQAHTHSISGTAAAQAITVGVGDAETRPINLSINAIIKI